MTQHRNPPIGQLSADEAEILAVIEADTDAYLRRDRKAWEACWVRDETFASMMECGGLITSRGYDTFREKIFNAMDEEATTSFSRVARENMSIQVEGDIGWAVFDQIMGRETTDAMDPPALSQNVRIMRRTPKGWRIAFHGVWASRGRDAEGPTVEVDAEARILWRSPQTEGVLDGRFGLTDSHGTLRAMRPAWDKELRAAIERASELTELIPYRRVTGLSGRPVSFPVVFGEDDEGRALVCRVRVTDFRLYVSFGEDVELARRLENARIVFGLSRGQTDLAALIAEGLSLTEAAERLEVSAHTVRTQLNRMFDKVGVRSQTALLRLVLAAD